MVLELSITTDYLEDTGSPEPCLRKISEAGFTHVHWCHEWHTVRLYSDSDIDEIAGWLEKYNLKILDLHASEGVRNDLFSEDESLRKLAVDLVRNRIYMAGRLSCEVVIVHFERGPKEESERERFWNVLHRSLDELTAYALECGVKIALENLETYDADDYRNMEVLFSEYGCDVLGLCYDSGHGHLRDGLDFLKGSLNRLISIHLHDNNGEDDDHKPLFSGTLDWDNLAEILARSSYEKCVSMEVSMKNSGFVDEVEFLRRAHEEGVLFHGLVESWLRKI